MVFIIGLECVRVLGVRFTNPEWLSVFLALMGTYVFIILTVRPHRFQRLLYLELMGTCLVLIATYLVQFAMLGDYGKATYVD